VFKETLPDLKLAERLMRTCYDMYRLMPLGLAPERVEVLRQTPGYRATHAVRACQTLGCSEGTHGACEHSAAVTVFSVSVFTDHGVTVVTIALLAAQSHLGLRFARC
jgi:hypothetical protein